MAANDLELIQAWTHHRDASAFATLYDRYGGLVFNTCLRVLRNGSDAEEVAQDCFLELSRAGDTVRTSVPAWLHTLATRRSLDRIRGAGRRRDREARYAEGSPVEEAVAWDDVAEFVDEAIAGLPEAQRTLVIARFMHGTSELDLQTQFGLTRGQVRYRLEQSVQEIRRSLRKRGISAAVPALYVLLDSQLAHGAAVPAALGKAVATIALAGVHTAVGASAGAGLALAKLAGGLVLAGALVVAVLQMAPWGNAATEAPAVVAAGVAEATPVAAEPLSNPPASGREVGVDGAMVEFALYVLSSDGELGTTAALPVGLAGVAATLKAEHGLSDLYLIRTMTAALPASHGLTYSVVIGDDQEVVSGPYVYPADATREERRALIAAAKADEAEPPSDLSIRRDGDVLGPQTFQVRLGNVNVGERETVQLKDLIVGFETPVRFLGAEHGQHVSRATIGLRQPEVDCRIGAPVFVGRGEYGGSGEAPVPVRSYIDIHPIFVVVVVEGS